MQRSLEGLALTFSENVGACAKWPRSCSRARAPPYVVACDSLLEFCTFNRSYACAKGLTFPGRGSCLAQAFLHMVVNLPSDSRLISTAFLPSKPFQAVKPNKFQGHRIRSVHMTPVTINGGLGGFLDSHDYSWLAVFKSVWVLWRLKSSRRLLAQPRGPVI